MAEENLIHVKIGYSEAVEGKKDTLSAEMNLLKIIQTIRKYELLRMKELKLKIKFYKKLKELKLNIKKLQITLPKIQIPEIKREEKIETKSNSKKDNIEEQLRKIQRKLESLESQ